MTFDDIISKVILVDDKHALFFGAPTEELCKYYYLFTLAVPYTRCPRLIALHRFNQSQHVAR